jgi:hypothetical protein
MVMAQGRSYLPDEMILETVAIDERGNEIIRITSSETNATEGGRQVARKTGRALMLVDGRLLLPHQLFGQKPLYVGVCRFCRTPPTRLWHREAPTHGLCSLERMKLCVDCGITSCLHHSHRSSWDHRCRCGPCHSKHKYLCLIQRIFTEQVPDDKE